MENIGCAVLAVAAVPASREYVACGWIEDVAVHADSDWHRSCDFTVIRVHDDHHPRSRGALAATADVQAAICLVHGHGNRRIAPRSGPFVFDGELHRVILDDLALIFVILEDASLAVGRGSLRI